MAQIFAGIPFNLLVYKPEQFKTALCWQVNLEPTVTLDTLDFEVQVDVVPTFDSINLKEYTKDNVTNYQNGTFFKSFVIDDPVLFESQTYYWRVRANNDYAQSYWSDIQKQNTSTFLDNLEYNKPTTVYYGNDITTIQIVKVYDTVYEINGIIYTESELIEQIHTLYGNNAIVLFNELEYDKAVKVNVKIFNDTTIPPEVSPTDNYITIKMQHSPCFSVVDSEINKQTKQDFINNLANYYGIDDEIFIYIGPQEFVINKGTWYDDTELAERLLPDRYVYTKAGNTNIKRILEMYMRLIGVLKAETQQLANDYNYEKIQDADLYDMLGVLLNYTRDTTQPFITYKYQLLNLWQAYLKQGTVETFDILFQALYGVKPEIEILKYIVDDKWTVYEQMPMLSIDGSTPSNLNITKGDAFYNSDINKVIIATEGNTVGDWNNALEQEPNVNTTYQQGLTNYFYDGTSQAFFEGRPDVKRYYVDYINETQIPWHTPAVTDTTPFLYTNQYLAHNIIIKVNNYYNINIDQKILMQIVNNLKPLNVNVTLIINNMTVEYKYGLIGHYGNPKYYWGKQVN